MDFRDCYFVTILRCLCYPSVPPQLLLGKQCLLFCSLDPPSQRHFLTRRWVVLERVLNLSGFPHCTMLHSDSACASRLPAPRPAWRPQIQSAALFPTTAPLPHRALGCTWRTWARTPPRRAAQGRPPSAPAPLATSGIAACRGWRAAAWQHAWWRLLREVRI